MSDVAQAELEAAPGAVVPFEDELPAVAEGHTHPGPRQYVMIGIILVILTGLEVAVSYLDGEVNSNLLIVILGVFIANEVSNWNAARVGREREQVLLA